MWIVASPFVLGGVNIAGGFLPGGDQTAAAPVLVVHGLRELGSGACNLMGEALFIAASCIVCLPSLRGQALAQSA